MKFVAELTWPDNSTFAPFSIASRRILFSLSRNACGSQCGHSWTMFLLELHPDRTFFELQFLKRQQIVVVHFLQLKHNQAQCRSGRCSEISQRQFAWRHL